MMAALRFVDRNGERWLVMWFYIFIVSVIFIEVLRRFVLNYSSIWGEETARFIFIYLVWVAAALGVRERTHIRINIITHFLGPRGKAAIYILGDVLTGVLAVVALYLSMHPVLSSIQFESVTDGLRVVRAWFLMAVPLGFTVILLRVVQSFIRDLQDFRGGKPVFEGHRMFD